MRLTLLVYTVSFSCSWSSSSFSSPSHSSTAVGTCSRPLDRESHFKRASRASRATSKTFESCTSSKEQMAGTTAPPWFLASANTCSWAPPVATLETTHAASLRTSHSSEASALSTALIISWCSSKEVIWALEPAAMLLSAQQASLRMPFFTWVTRGAIASRPWASTTAWVWPSSPETMFPIVRRAGVTTDGEAWPSSATSRGTTPEATTAPTRSLSPSER
mmetsp:Transcript_28882/g.64580  ORF Transcript_28882/g.64580 Transcript_28882/m.64580 type:complete len:220 (+) Transcript_28882:440-1099(+)